VPLETVKALIMAAQRFVDERYLEI
jgi:hypothetical protein